MSLPGKLADKIPDDEYYIPECDKSPLVEVYQRFGGVYCLYFKGLRVSRGLHLPDNNVTSLNIAPFIVRVVKISIVTEHQMFTNFSGVHVILNTRKIYSIQNLLNLRVMEYNPKLNWIQRCVANFIRNNNSRDFLAIFHYT